jgi:lysozyme
VSDPRLVNDLKTAEGEKLQSYKDSLGFWTIGVGHLLPAPCTPEGWAGYTISQDVCDRFLDEDIAKATKGAGGLPEYAECDTDCRKNALIELVFNMGVGKWSGFVTTRAAIKAQNWQGAHDGLLHSLWATQVGATRSQRLASYLLTGQYP